MKRLLTIYYSPLAFDIATLILRVGFGILMIPSHGYAKLATYSERKDDFMSFLGLGGPLSLALAIFAEFFCSVLLMAGLFTRLAVIPLIITMLVAFSVHDWEFFGKYDLIPAFLLGYFAILLLGPGKFSIDALFKFK